MYVYVCACPAYSTARLVNSEAQQRRMLASTASKPRWFKKVSCWPAKDASSVSSVVAEERTATGTSAPSLEHIAWYCTAMDSTWRRHRTPQQYTREVNVLLLLLLLVGTYINACVPFLLVEAAC